MTNLTVRGVRGVMSRTYGKIRVACENAIARITLFNPERRNAIGPQMTNELLWCG